LQASQTIIKDTLSGRRNISPQNIYEVTQLFAAGALRVACVGIQCIGFDEALYKALLDHASFCAHAARWRAPLGPGAHANAGSQSPAAAPHANMSGGTPVGFGHGPPKGIIGGGTMSSAGLSAYAGIGLGRPSVVPASVPVLSPRQFSGSLAVNRAVGAPSLVGL
jgi:hypothetical protein